jgi:hypothetical protein
MLKMVKAPATPITMGKVARTIGTAPLRPAQETKSFSRQPKRIAEVLLPDRSMMRFERLPGGAGGERNGRHCVGISIAAANGASTAPDRRY